MSGESVRFEDILTQLEEKRQALEKREQEADRLLRERGVRLSGVNPLAKYGSMLTAKLRVRSSRNTTARIAEMLVQGNTRGMVKSMQNLRAMGVLDPKVSSLSTRLLQTEQANIEEMKHFL